MHARPSRAVLLPLLGLAAALLTTSPVAQPLPSPRVILVSADGASPDVIDAFIRSRVLPSDTGFGRLQRTGVIATANIPVTPSLTFGAHVAIATGSSPARNDISSNAMHPVAGPLATNMSGTLAPIGGYRLNPLGPLSQPGAEPLWVTLRNAGRTVITATWIGADGEDIRIAGTSVHRRYHAHGRLQRALRRVRRHSRPRIRPRHVRISSPAIPGSRDSSRQAGIGRTARCKSQNNRLKPCSALLRAPAPAVPDASGRTRRYELTVGAFDTTNNQTTDYDALVVFDALTGIAAGPFALHLRSRLCSSRGRLGAVLLEGSEGRVGTRLFVAAMAPDLSGCTWRRLLSTVHSTEPGGPALR